MDDFLKQLIMENQLTLLLTAIVFAPVGIYAVYRRFVGRARSPIEENDRLAGLEAAVERISVDVASLAAAQRGLAARLGTPVSGAQLGRIERVATPVP